MTFIVVLGLIVVVILVVVLVALGMRASRQAREDDDDWMADDEPQVHHDGPVEEVDEGYAAGYDRRVAGGPLSAPLSAPPAEPEAAPRRGRANNEMADDDYWATITFDKPKFPWQHDGAPDPAEMERGADPLATSPDEHDVTAPAAGPSSTGPEPAFAPDPLHVPAAAAQPPDPLGLGPNPGHPNQGQPGRPSHADPLGLGQGPGGHAPDPLGMAPNPPSHVPDPLGMAPSPPPRPESNPADATQAFQAYSGSNDALSGFGDNPLSGSSGSTGSPSGSGSAGDTDSQRLPTVDELLQRIQSGRQRSGSAPSDSHAQPPAPQPPATPSYGGSLTDPLNDPLSTTGDSYGTAPWSPSPSYDSDPLHGPGGEPTGPHSSGTGGLSGSGFSGGGYGGYGTGSSSQDGYGTGTSSQDGYGTGPQNPGGYGTGPQNPGGYGTGPQNPSGYGTGPQNPSPGQGYSTGDYPTSPAYGESPRYDDPLGGGYDNGSSSRDSYGSFGGQSESSSTSPLSGSQPPDAGRYSDFTGNSGYGDSSDPLGTTGYGDPGAQPPTQQPGGYGTGGSGYYGADQSYGQQPPASEPGNSYGSGYDTGEHQRRTPEDWDNYRGDFRR